MPNRRQFCTFMADRFYLGIEAHTVQEVIRNHESTPVPLAPREVTGLINLRGQIVAAVDLRTRLHLPPRTGNTVPMHVVVKTPDGLVSLTVDEIDDVIEVDDETYEPPLETVKRPIRDLVSGVYKLKDRLLLILDTQKAVAIGGSAVPAAKGG